MQSAKLKTSYQLRTKPLTQRNFERQGVRSERGEAVEIYGDPLESHDNAVLRNLSKSVDAEKFRKTRRKAGSEMKL